MDIAVIGLGASGSQLARQLAISSVERLSLFDIDARRLRRTTTAVEAIADDATTEVTSGPILDEPVPDVVAIATPVGTQLELARTWLSRGSDVVTTSDDPDEVSGLLELHDEAVEAGRSVVVGAAFVPGLSCVLTRFAADGLDEVEVISVYKAATGGPACARQHHRALKSSGYDWLDGEWVLRRGGSGRDLAWFPDPFGARDCYRGALPSPFLLQPVFPAAQRISARMAATRRDRFTSRLPMLRPPHADGGPGALRVEVRGRRDRAVETIILGVIDHPSVVTGIVAAIVTEEVGSGRVAPGAAGLATWDDPAALLRLLWPRGVRVASFDGTLEAQLSEPAPTISSVIDADLAATD
ncbi:MAG: hypothetical protein AAF962_06530 [Actinomycetota bacterium]